MLRPLVWFSGTFAVIPAAVGEHPEGMIPIGVSVMEEESLVVAEFLLAQVSAMAAEEGVC